MLTPHGAKTERLLPLLDLPPHQVCVVKHGQNITQVEKVVHEETRPPFTLEELQKRGLVLAEEQTDVEGILREFGITEYD